MVPLVYPKERLPTDNCKIRYGNDREPQSTEFNVGEPETQGKPR